MNKKEIFEKLYSLELDKNKYIVISGASLVAHNIIENTDDIDLSCDDQYYKTINWPQKLGYFKVEIKYKDIFEISNNLYVPDKIDIINGYKFMNLEECLKLKKKCNREKDKPVIKRLEYLLMKEKSPKV